MIQIKINTKPKLRKEDLQAVGCKTDSVERTDDLEKNKKTKQDEPVRTITKKIKCKLKDTNSPRHKTEKELTGTSTGTEVELSKSKLDKLMGTDSPQTKDKRTKIDIDALKRVLGVEGNTLEEITLNALRKGIRNSPRLKEKVSKYEQDKKKKERNRKYHAQRNKEEMNLPLTAINRDFMTLANGIMEEDLSAQAEKVKVAFERISDFLKEKYGDNQTTDIWETKKKEKSWDIN